MQAPHLTDLTDPTCAICKRPGRRRIVDADASDGIAPAAIAAAMRDVGWALTAAQVATHITLHGSVTKPKSAASRKRDAALTLRERMMDALEGRIEAAEEKAVEATEECRRGEHDVDDHPRYRKHGPKTHESSEFFDILNKDLQSALGTVIKAQTVEEKRVATEGKRKIDLFRLMMGPGDGLAPSGLIGDGSIEGDFEEVPDGPA